MRRLVAVISAIVFLDAMLFGALIPLVPAYVDDFDLSKLQAGMLVGDILLRFDGEPLQSPGDLQDRLGRATPGHESSVTVLRGGQLEQLGVIVGERPQA